MDAYFNSIGSLRTANLYLYHVSGHGIPLCDRLPNYLNGNLLAYLGFEKAKLEREYRELTYINEYLLRLAPDEPCLVTVESNPVGHEGNVHSTVIHLETITEFINKSQKLALPVSRWGCSILLEKRTALRKLLRLVGRVIRSIKGALDRIEPRFCGLNWSRRVWSLLHGSHPPKLDALCDISQCLGCV